MVLEMFALIWLCVALNSVSEGKARAWTGQGKAKQGKTRQGQGKAKKGKVRQGTGNGGKERHNIIHI